MAVPQQKYRELVFLMLYSYAEGSPDENEVERLLMKELSVTKKNVKLALEKVKAILKQKSEIDEKIAKASLSYAFERIQTVEKNILRLGVYELFYEDGIPPKVSISEAIRLSRKFATKESSAYINAILDHLYKESVGAASDLSAIQESAENLIQSEELAKKAIEEEKKKT